MQIQHEHQTAQQLPLPAEQTALGAATLTNVMQPHDNLWQRPGVHAFGRITITAAMKSNVPVK